MNCDVKDNITPIILKQRFTFVGKIFFPEGLLPLYCLKTEPNAIWQLKFRFLVLVQMP